MNAPASSRRQFLRSGSTLAAGSLLSSCGSPLPFPKCPNELIVSRAHPDDVVVDSHCHVFNGRDIDIASYALALTREKGGIVGYALLREFVAAYLTALRELAPCIEDELNRAEDVVKAVKGMPFHSDRRVNKINAELIKVFGVAPLKELKCKTNINYTEPHWIFRPSKGRGSKRAEELREHFREALTASEHGDAKYCVDKKQCQDQVSRVLNQIDREAAHLLVHFTNYRTVNAYELWRQFAREFDRQNVDLFVVASLDMNAWLCANRKIKSGEGSHYEARDTYMRYQVNLMEQISVLFGGELMTMAGWCPRFAAEVSCGKHKKNHPTFEHPLITFQDAVLNRGHLGAKLYPPMGFRAYNNKELDHATFSRGFLGLDTPEAKTAFGGELGKALDKELEHFYQWCACNDVPIMAHTGPSHGSRIGYALRARPDYWDKVLNPPTGASPDNLGLSNLRVNLAHFGCWHPDGPFSLARLVGGSDNAKWGEMIASMISHHPNVFSDIADMTDICNKQGWDKTFEKHLDRWSSLVPRSSPNHVTRKMMYGSDWFVMAQSDVFRDDDEAFSAHDETKLAGRTYLQRWSRFFRSMEERKGWSSSDVMGHNALRFLGLNTRKVRDRVDAFFDKHDVERPVWRSKLEKLLEQGRV